MTATEIPESLVPTVTAIRDVIAARRQGVLLVGPPGLGFTMAARHVADTLPEPEGAVLDRIRAAQFRAYATAGLLDWRAPRAPERPFRAPHHTVSDAALVGVTGTYRAYSGEVALAMGGVLMLDELADFRRSAIEALRERVGSMGLYERPFLIATATPCPCGFFKSKTKVCACSSGGVLRHNERVMGYASLLRLTVFEVRP